MTDHPQVKGYNVTQLGSMADIAALRTGSTAGHDFCHDLTPSEGATVTFSSEIMGRGQFPDQQLLSRPLDTTRYGQICKSLSDTEGVFFLLNGLKMIYYLTPGERHVYSETSKQV